MGNLTLTLIALKGKLSTFKRIPKDILSDLFKLPFFFLLYFIPSFGEGLYISQKSNSKVNITNHLSVAKDTSNSWQINDIINQKDIWSPPVKGNILNFGMTLHAHWIKLNIENQGNNQYLRLSEPMINEIDLYLVKETELIKHSQSGSSLPFAHREINVNRYLFHLPEGLYTCYIRLKSNFSLQTSIDIAPWMYFMEQEYEHGMLLALYFGFMLVILVYNLFIYYSVNDKTYLYYITYIFGLTLACATFKGISFQFLWPAQPYLNFLIPTLVSSTIIFVGLFSSSFLQTQTYVPKLSRGIYLLISIFLLCIVINLSGDYTISNLICQISTMVSSVYLILLGIISWSKGFHSARFFVIGWTIYLSFVTMYILKLNVPHNNFTDNAVLYGSAIEAVSFSFALGDRINIMRKETAHAQRERQYALEKQLKTEQTLDQTQNELIKTAKLASIGRTISRIAHELNTPIYIAHSSAEHINKQIKQLLKTLASQPTSKPMDHLKQYEQNITNMSKGLMTNLKRAARLVANFRETSADQTNVQNKYFKLKDYIHTTLISHELSLQKRQIQVNLNGDNPIIYTDPGFIYQIIQNLLTNTQKYGYPQGKGNIDIHVQDTNQNITIIYKDYGKGIPKNIFDHIFKPLYHRRRYWGDRFGHEHRIFGDYRTFIWNDYM